MRTEPDEGLLRSFQCSGEFQPLGTASYVVVASSLPTFTTALSPLPISHPLFLLSPSHTHTHTHTHTCTYTHTCTHTHIHSHANTERWSTSRHVHGSSGRHHICKSEIQGLGLHTLQREPVRHLVASPRGGGVTPIEPIVTTVSVGQEILTVIFAA